MAASSASITAPGPTGIPASRSTRAKCMMFSASLPESGRWFWLAGLENGFCTILMYATSSGFHP